jgi:putative Holliday junction resolvase
MIERLIALDVGDKRIGVDVSDALHITAQPLGKIERAGFTRDVSRIAELCEKYQTNHILLGLPRNMDGTLGVQAKKVQTFAEQLQKAGFRIQYWDERMTTVSAERLLIQAGTRREKRKKVVDQIAAALILQGYLDANQEAERVRAVKNESEGNSMENERDNVVELIDDQGNPAFFEHLMTLEYEKRVYVILTPKDTESADEEGMAVIMRISKDDNGDDCYIVEEDDETLEAVFNKYLELSDDMEAYDDDYDDYEAFEEDEENE